MLGGIPAITTGSRKSVFRQEALCPIVRRNVLVKAEEVRRVVAPSDRSAHAAVLHGESLRLRWDVSIWEAVIGSLVDLASLAAMTEDPREAARLFGSAEALREASGRLLTANYPERVVYERERTGALTALGAEGFAAAKSAGRMLPRERAISEALDLADAIARSV